MIVDLGMTEVGLHWEQMEEVLEVDLKGLEHWKEVS